MFVDVDPVTLNLDPAKIEAAITPQTTAIMPVHCYGHPCDVDAIQKIADNYNLKVIYDAAHAFGVQRRAAAACCRHGDLSVLSFHATKVFNTFEGGAIVCPDAKTKQRIDHLKNFGFVDEITVVAPGINGKMSEIQRRVRPAAATAHGQALGRRQEHRCRLPRALRDVHGYSLPAGRGRDVPIMPTFPILVEPDYPMQPRRACTKAQRPQYYARRYFYPLISEFPMYRGMPSAHRENLPVATDAANKVLCLPIYPALTCKNCNASSTS